MCFRRGHLDRRLSTIHAFWESNSFGGRFADMDSSCSRLIQVFCLTKLSNPVTLSFVKMFLLLFTLCERCFFARPCLFKVKVPPALPPSQLFQTAECCSSFLRVARRGASQGLATFGAGSPELCLCDPGSSLSDFQAAAVLVFLESRERLRLVSPR